MATADEYAQWIVANQDKKGTPDFETVAKAYNEAKMQEQQPSALKTADSVARLAYKATPLGMLQTVQETGNEIVDKQRNFLGAKTLEATGSPELATAAYMSPDIANFVVGNRLASIPQKVAPNNPLGQAANRVGFNPTWGQRTGNPTLLQVEDTMRRMPVTGGTFAKNDMANQKSINKAVSSAIGQQSDSITGEVLANAQDDLGNVRNVLKRDVNIPKGNESVLKTIENESLELKKSLRSTGQWNNDVERIKQAINSGNISGEQYQIWRTDLKDAQDAAFKAGKSKLGNAYKAVRDALDDAARGGASDAWRANDKAFSTLEMIQEGNVVNPVTGNVSAPLLANKFYQRFGKTAKQGKMPGPIQDIATLQKGYPLWREGSPTAKAEMYDSIPSWLAGTAGYPLAKLLTSDPYQAVRYLMYGPSGASGISGLLESDQ